MKPVDFVDRGPLRHRTATAIVAGLPSDIAERELKAARKVVKEWPEESFSKLELPAERGPGNVLLLEAAYENVIEIMSGFGKLGVSAERLAQTAARRMSGYCDGRAFAGPYLQDQLLLPFAVAGGGSFTTVKLSEHSLTAAKLIERFTGRGFAFSTLDDGSNLVEVRG